MNERMGETKLECWVRSRPRILISRQAQEILLLEQAVVDIDLVFDCVGWAINPA
jgi:hypothetical protein